MDEITFVNRRVAEAEAARGIGLLQDADGSKIEAWFAMQAVADQLGPASNTGMRGITWKRDIASRGACKYRLTAACVNGRLETSTAAPRDEAEALSPERLRVVEALFLRKVAELGGQVRERRPVGTGVALVEAVSASEDGRRWVENTVTADKRLMLMVRVADAYGRGGVNPRASLSAHVALITFDNRAELILGAEEIDQARAKALALRGYGALVRSRPLTRVSARHEINLAIRAGVTRQEARMILRARVDGRSQKALIRAVQEADRVLAEPVRAGRPRKDQMSIRAVAALAQPPGCT